MVDIDMNMEHPPSARRPSFFRRFVRLRLWLAVPIVATVLLPGCSGSGDIPPSLELPVTPVISVRSSWVVVRGAYVRVLSEPRVDASIEGHVRRGVILEIDGRTRYVDTVDGQRNHWFAVSNDDVSGWIFASYVDTYANRSLAETASRSIRGQ